MSTVARLFNIFSFHTGIYSQNPQKRKAKERMKLRGKQQQIPGVTKRGNPRSWVKTPFTPTTPGKQQKEQKEEEKQESKRDRANRASKNLLPDLEKEAQPQPSTSTSTNPG